MPDTRDNPLGNYLRDRRTRLDPAALGFSLTRRRTPGLRREEVAQRAHVSATWYTWLEQGRGGAPSADVLARIARALMLTEAEREYVFLLALGRPPEVRFQDPEGVTPRLQRVLDSLETSAAYVKTSTWDVVAWNHASTLVLTDYGALPVGQRNILRVVFGSAALRRKMPNWERDSRFIVGAFRADVARAGAAARVQPMVDELCQLDPEFRALWRDNGVQSSYGEHPKHVVHPVAGPIDLEYSAFAVDGRPDLGMVIYTPATPRDLARVKALIAAGEEGKAAAAASAAVRRKRQTTPA
jgi:transcriptional regulator with XRE-family HTH domain